ncbi:hypothetical protein HK405_002305, partial [Cladochytrium tenue]
RRSSTTSNIAVRPGSFLRFVKCDASLLENVRKAVEEVKAMDEIKNGGVDWLVTVSGLSGDDRKETAEGRDLLMAVTFWARMIFTESLIPQLAMRNGCAMCIHRGGLDAASTRPVDLDDLDMKNISPYSFFAVMERTGQLIDGIFKELALRNAASKVRFLHTTPGLVVSPIFEKWPYFIRTVVYILSPFISRTPEQNADAMLSMLAEGGKEAREPVGSSVFEVRNEWGEYKEMAGWIRTDPHASGRVYEAFRKIAD